VAVGSRIKACRKEARLTLKDMSKLIGISMSFLSDIENGRSNPSLDRLGQIAEKLGTSVSWLMGEDWAVKEVPRDYKVSQLSGVLEDLADFPKFREVIDYLKDFPKWCDSDQEELISYLKAKKLSKKGGTE